MLRLIVIITLCFGNFMLLGCATMQDMNPFSTRPFNPSEVVYSQFSNIPVPKDLSPSPKRSFTNYNPDGAKNGMETLEGNVDQTDLARAMVSNMVRDGWSLRMALSGQGRDIQVYEQKSSYAVIYYYRQTTTVAMEIWVGSRLADGAWQPHNQGAIPVGGGYVPPSAPLNSPPSRPSSGGPQERALP